MKKLLLKELLEKIEDVDWQLSAFTQKDNPFNENTQVVISDSEEDVLQINGDTFFYTLNIQTIQEIVENAKLQEPNVSIEKLVDAFNFYYDNDAFIVLDKVL